MPYFYPIMRTFIAALSLFFCTSILAQTSTDIGVWVDHLPYRGGIAMHQEGNTMYCVTKQGIFTLDILERTINRISKVNGLSDIGISAAAWSDKYDVYVIGYENGNIDVLEGEEVKNYPELKLTGNYPGLKQINNIFIQDDLAYISTDFGIITFDLNVRIVRETFIIGANGATTKVLDTEIANDRIYAATDEGLLSADLSDPLIFFGSWSADSSRGTGINMLTNFEGRLFANDVNGANSDSVLYLENGVWTHFAAVDLNVNSYLNAENGLLNITNSFAARAYSFDGQLQNNVVAAAVELNDFAPKACMPDNENPEVFWILSNVNGLILNFQKQFNQRYEPNSPISEKAFTLHHDGERLFVAPGTINEVWAPLFNNDGYYILKDFDWDNRRLDANPSMRDVLAMISDPDDTEHYYLSSYGNGVLEYRDGQFVRLYSDTTTNDAMPNAGNPGTHRVGGFSYDLDGNLWFTNSLTDEPACRIDENGEVACFTLGSVLGSGSQVKNILYTTENQIWLQTRTNGIVVANFQDGAVTGVTRLAAVEGSGNLPSTRVFCFAEDLDGEMWIGTDEGVTVIFSPINIFEPNANYDASTPQIPQPDNPGFGDPLLGNEAINDIEIDGANKKWFATAGSGVFYTSEDGTEQIYNFTSDNSPLLSNNVIDIEVDPKTGVVYFATDRGIVSFQGVATEGGTTNSDVFAYPNPVEPGYRGPILIRGLVTNAQVKITDVEGNLVFETVAEGGQALWNGNNFSGQRVASGVYLAYITDELGQRTAVTKILVVN